MKVYVVTHYTWDPDQRQHWSTNVAVLSSRDEADAYCRVHEDSKDPQRYPNFEVEEWEVGAVQRDLDSITTVR